MDVVCKRLDAEAPCKTAKIPLPGVPIVTKGQVEKSAQESGLSVETVAYLAALYGSRFSQVLELARKDARGKQPLCPHSKDIVAQIWHAVNEESAITVSDFMLRRSAIGLMQCQGLDAVEPVAKEMSRLLGWDPAEQKRQADEYLNTAALGQRYKTETNALIK
ncbi:MAG: hypothetical protein NTX46_03915 [Chloroflexi bacterium]|nr:hypothetical protein [Chloroflexota bacterium]